MQIGDRQEISEAHLIGHSVLDRENCSLGTVVSTQQVGNDEFALIVQFSVSETERDNFTIDSSHVVAIDPEHRMIHTDLDFNLVVPNQDKTIPLVQESLVVNRQRQKVGEIVLRKVIETDWVQIPVHREKLVVQAEGEAEPIAEISLGETQLPAGTAIEPAMNPYRHSNVEVLGQWQAIEPALQTLSQFSADSSTANTPIGVILSLNIRQPTSTSEQVRMEFASPRTAAYLLSALASGWWQNCQEIRLEKIV